MREWQAAMDSAEFGEWIAYHTLEPFGPEREDYRAGVVASACVAPWAKKGSEPPAPLEWFEPLYAAAKRAAEGARPARRIRQWSPREIRDRMLALTRAMGGTVVGGSGG